MKLIEVLANLALSPQSKETSERELVEIMKYYYYSCYYGRVPTVCVVMYIVMLERKIDISSFEF